MRWLLAALMGWAAAGAAPAQAQDHLTATAAARELGEMCRGDAGQLWGVDLCGPLMVVDPATRGVWTSAPDGAGALRQAGVGWAGELPPGVPTLNGAVEWGGVRWIQVLSPLPGDSTERRVLLAHEAWSRVQAALGFSAQTSSAPHLETERGRTLLRLEMRALAVAMRSTGRGRREAATEALLFRNQRLRVFDGAAAQEASLDRNEGLAAYTGVRLGVAENPQIYAARTLDRYDRRQSLARSYAFATGPAYGLLLDEYRPSWRLELGNHAPADILAVELEPRFGRAAPLSRASERYGGDAIAAEEQARAAAHQARLAELRRSFERGRRVELPLTAVQWEFDPNGVTPIEGLGTYYRVLTVREGWGELRAQNGALIAAGASQVVVSSPGPDPAQGPGWRLELAPGFQLIGPDGAGVYRPVQTPADAPPP